VDWRSRAKRLVVGFRSDAGRHLTELRPSGFATGNAPLRPPTKGNERPRRWLARSPTFQWSGPITITQGGTYSGNLKSTNPNTAAVTISTTAPVIVENSYVTGPADLIDDPDYSNNLTVKNVIGIGVNPNVSGQSYGVRLIFAFAIAF
jgi:hypothetical protein